MSTEVYRHALATAEEELGRLLRAREEIDLRVASLRQTVASLASLCGEPGRVQLGLSEACRTVLKAAGGRELTPVEVRDALAAMGFDLERYASPLAVIHTVVKRLCEADKVTAVPRGGRVTAYRWRRPFGTVVLRRGEEVPRLEDLEELRGSFGDPAEGPLEGEEEP